MLYKITEKYSADYFFEIELVGSNKHFSCEIQGNGE